MEIFKDANYSSSTLNFSVGEKIYVRVESDNSGDTKRELKLRDNFYKEISTFGFSRESSAPYIYKVSFSAPSSAGYYSLEATIQSGGSVDKLVQTIRVGEMSNAQIKTDIRTQVNTGSKVSGIITPSPQPKKGEVLATEGARLEATPTPSPLTTPQSTPVPKPFVFRFFGAIGSLSVAIFKFFVRF
ncbi:hypothetical protein A2Z23_02770 [Candidatus Curtissbacteria bacterium RBG_16_39_7]|uniref:Uncharacterized protein n=1 Tax=Candidatus Curtissbacteria bacterium RBG_16_39_7 TaxID=1797707 RepID=A0A1F5G4L6_9BACT|nr:MAG: hypothetical protein A2Z23_02770 [Candidatus Curtissbacteria bacterium RBG_16_39_7]